MNIRSELMTTINTLGYQSYVIVPENSDNEPYVLIKVNTVVNLAISGETHKKSEAILTIFGHRDVSQHEIMEKQVIATMLNQGWIHSKTNDMSLDPTTNQKLSVLQTELTFKTIRN